MNKTEFIKTFKEATGLPGLEAEEYLNRLGDIMATELLAGGEVPIPGVGKLVVKETAARKGRNPRTGESLEIAASRKVSVNLSKSFKDSFK